ncbi:MAG: hypothetical protein Q9210_004214 [Variospora velana]
MFNLRAELERLPNEPLLHPDTQASLSSKPEAQQFDPLIHYRYRDDYNTPDFKNEIHRELGPEQAEDTHILSMPTRFSQGPREILGNEVDVTRLFHRLISGPIMEALDHFNVTERAQTGPIGNTHIRTGDEVILAVEHKRPLMIKEEWSQPDNDGFATRNKLSRELRMYAFQYRCPHICLFDGKKMVFIRFRAPQQGYYGLRLTLRVIFYLMLREGIARARAMRSPQVILDGWQRSFRWYDGKPHWRKQNQQATWDPPAGYARDWDRTVQRWFWKRNDGSFVTWDTRAV